MRFGAALSDYAAATGRELPLVTTRIETPLEPTLALALGATTCADLRYDCSDDSRCPRELRVTGSITTGPRTPPSATAMAAKARALGTMPTFTASTGASSAAVIWPESAEADIGTLRNDRPCAVSAVTAAAALPRA